MEELKSIVTRIGKNSTLVLCGDVAQCDLKQGSGLSHFLELRKESPRLTRMIQHVDFNEFDDIVRSDVCREIVQGFAEIGVI